MENLRTKNNISSAASFDAGAHCAELVYLEDLPFQTHTFLARAAYCKAKTGAIRTGPMMD
jgi:hypothetical protein